MKAKKENGFEKGEKKITTELLSPYSGSNARLNFSGGKYYGDIETKPPSTPKPRNNKK